MDFIRQQMTVLAERLGGLTASQKMLTAALAVIAVMTLLYWGKAASTPEMVPLANTSIGGEDLAKVTAALTAHGIPYETTGGKILVPASRQDEALADVSTSGTLSPQATDIFENMLSKTSPLDGAAKFDAQMTDVTERRLVASIKNFPGVANVQIIITPGQKFGISKPLASASVIITTNGSNVSRKRIAEGAAAAVASSVGTERSKVTVTVDGRAVDVANANDLASADNSDLIQQQKDWEELYRQKIMAPFIDIPGLAVDVTVAVDTEASHTVKNDVDPTKRISIAQQTTEEKSVTTDPPSAAAEPGVRSNTALDVSNVKVASAPSGSTMQKTEEKNTTDYGRSVIESTHQPGGAKVLSAMIRVPRGWFVRSYKKSHPNDGEPAGEAFEAYLSSELEKMRVVVKNSTVIENDTLVSALINPYDIDDDGSATGGPLLAAASTTGAGLTVFAAGHAKDVAVGVLAVASLFMVGRMVKKSAPPMPEPILALDNDVTPLSVRTAATSGATVAKVRGTLNGADDISGDVAESGSVMMGHELDEAVLETSQMVDQVGTFVKDNPDMAAQLVRRWLSQE